MYFSTKLNKLELAGKMYQIYSLKKTAEGLKHVGLMQNLNKLVTVTCE
jgi:hypothetical protein